MKNRKFLEAAFIVIAIIAGFNIQLNWFTIQWDPKIYTTVGDFAKSESWVSFSMKWRLIISSLLLPIFLYGLRYAISYILKLFDGLKNNINEYKKYDAIAYLPLLLTCTGYFGVEINFFLIGVLFFIIQSYLIFKIYAENNKIDMNSGQVKNNRLYILFFISGFAALIYQVVWQRALFCFFGVNIESVTIIVSDFMFGLGLGALLGGYLSKKYPNRLPHLFTVCEAMIGVFGLFSLKLFGMLNSITLHSSHLTIALTVYGVLAIPTICMGATLPILIEYFHQRIMKVGKTVSFLYFINTSGSAIASFFTVEVLFLYFGMHFSTILASICNLFVAVTGALFIKQNRNLSIIHDNSGNLNLSIQQNGPSKMRFYFILFLAGIIGYIAMSQEILWIRFLSFATGGKSTVFPFLVGSILLGIALGSIITSMISEKQKERLMSIVGVNLLIAAILYFLSIPILSEWSVTFQVENVVLIMYISSGLISLLMGMTFPILAQFAIHSYKNVGLSVSWIYFANIVGSTIGPILTGFILLDLISFEKNVLLLSIMTWILGVLLWAANIKSYSIKYIYKPILIISCLCAFIFFPQLYNNIFEKLQNRNYYDEQKFKYIIQNRSGIITVIKQEKGDDIISGGGFYDGRFNTSLTNNNNSIDRAYMIAAFRIELKDFLEIGLSSGSWSRVVANHQGVENLDIIEIDPGYLDIITKYPEQKTLLFDKKVKIHIDDGRRWLTRTNKKFDFILMNTSGYWRNQINNLVSKEFLQICKDHLKDGGVLYYNTTGSRDIFYTTAKIFNYVTGYENFIAASDKPFPSDSIEKRNNLLKFVDNGRPVFDEKNLILKKYLNYFASAQLINFRELFLTKYGKYFITDDNLASEFKTRNQPYIKERAWSFIFY